MTIPFDDNTRFAPVATVERAIAGQRRLVQPLDTDTPTQLAGSAPIIWGLLEQHQTVNEILPELQRMFSDSPELIAGGIRSAFTMFLDSELMTRVDNQ